MKNNIPKSYSKVLTGEVKEGDLLWTPETKQFESPSLGELGCPVTAFKAVIRKKN